MYVFLESSHTFFLLCSLLVQSKWMHIGMVVLINQELYLLEGLHDVGVALNLYAEELIDEAIK